jgi:hypothetical protein
MIFANYGAFLEPLFSPINSNFNQISQVFPFFGEKYFLNHNNGHWHKSKKATSVRTAYLIEGF